MGENYQGDGIPVFLINGFLESGKTSFIQYTMNQEYFQTNGNTLLLLCEEGEKEYDPIELAKLHTTPIYMKDITDFQEEKLRKLTDTYKPERILIEWNGMWNQDDLYGGPMSEAVLSEQQNREPKYTVSMPKEWFLYQVITIVDGSTLKMYLSNMRSFLGQMLRNAELCIVNRCDNLSNEEMIDYRRKLRAMGQLVSGYLDFAERQAEKEQPMTMNDWANYLDRILTMSGEQLLQDAGKVSHSEAMEHASNEYRKYKQRTISDVEHDYLNAIKRLEDRGKKGNNEEQ